MVISQVLVQVAYCFIQYPVNIYVEQSKW